MLNTLTIKWLLLITLYSMLSVAHAGIITRSYTNNVPALNIDPRQVTPQEREVTVPATDFPAGAKITDVNIAITFDKRDDNSGLCEFLSNNQVWTNEITFRLIGPDGATVSLVEANTGYYASREYPGIITVTFDDEGAVFPSPGTPLAGSWQPQGNLSDFDSSSSIAGIWTLYMDDSSPRDPLCVYSYTLTIEATTDADISVTKSDLTPQDEYIPGGSSTYQVLISNAGPADAFDLVVNDPLPAGALSASWICSASGGANCDTASGTDGINNITVDIPNGDSVTFTYTVNWSSDPADY